MTDTTPSFDGNSQSSAVKADGFVDYYELIHEESDATVARIRSTITDLYNEAQANRDHRNLNKRRVYQELLDLLPQAREFLLDEDIRHKYNIYREESLDGIAKQSFEEWKKETLVSEDDGDGNEVLGVQEEQQRLRGQEVRAQVLKVAKEKQPKPRVAIDEEQPTAPSYSTPLTQGLGASAIVFFAILVIVKVLFRASWPISIVAGLVLGIVIWLVARFADQASTSI